MPNPNLTMLGLPMKIRRRSVLVHPPRSGLRGRLVLPGSKSITNRALLIAALANGSSTLTGALSSDDTLYMAEALRQMGVSVNSRQPDGVHRGQHRNAQSAVEASVSPAMPGPPCAFSPPRQRRVRGTVVVDGDEHMRRRPHRSARGGFAGLGRGGHETANCPPVTIHGTGGFTRDQVEIDGSLSSQFISAVMMTARRAVPGRSISPFPMPTSADAAISTSRRRSWKPLAVVSFQPARRRGASSRPATSHAPMPSSPDASAATYLWAAERLTRGQIELGTQPDRMSQPDA